MNKFDKYIKNRVFLITGAGSGIGMETATQILAYGGIVYAIVRKPESLSKLKSIYKMNIVIIKGDVTNEKDCLKFVKKAATDKIEIHGLIHCAGVGLRSSAKDTRHSTLKQIIETNFYSLVYLYHASRKQLEISKGTFMVISSIQGKLPLPYRSAYSAAKHAIYSYVKSIRLEEKDIHFTILNFGYVNTGFSVNALKGDGNKFLKQSDAQKKGMAVEKAAAIILNSLVRKKKEITPAGVKEKFVLFIYRNLPFIYDWLITKHVKPE
jgi:short-subunit dehydrogenase